MVGRTVLCAEGVDSNPGELVVLGYVVARDDGGGPWQNGLEIWECQELRDVL